ncbi:MAG: hypothetical protein ACR2MG_00280 [Pyrinomonadaceae bacterium]
MIAPESNSNEGQAMNHPAEKLSFPKTLRFTAGAALLLLSLTVSFYAQETDTMSISAVKNDIRYTEWQLKNLGRGRKPQTSIEPIEWEQVREDFLQLQVASRDLRKSVSSGATLDLRFLKDTVNEIKKRAVRLKRSLPLPAPEKEIEDLKVVEQPFEVAVKTLYGAVIRFTGNPVFKNALVIDLNDGAQARRDLQTIIALNENLKKRLATVSPDKR